MASYRLGGVKATFDQKCDYLNDLISSDHSLGIFVGQALYRLTWREIQDIGNLMVTIKNEEDKAYDNRTETETADA